MDKKYYQLATHNECQWDELHSELTNSGSNSEVVPNRSVCCVDDQLHSKTRGTYLLTDEEAALLGSDPRIKFINIDYKEYSKIYKPPPEELQATTAELLDRWTGPVKNIRRINGLTTGDADINRTGYQLLRLQQFLDPWVGTYADNTNITENISQYGTGKNVDVIVGDDGTWFGHPEFQNNPVKVSDGTPIETPNDYVGGNVLPGNGYCDLLDLVLDAPYYLDPDWFDADPENRLKTRWDGTIVPLENIARIWWADSSQRSPKFSSVGTVSVTPAYTRAYNNGSNISLSTVGDHGTPCAALTYGRTQGWAYNANKWAFNFYGVNGADIEQGFDIVKLFHQLKPVNSLYGNKNPTLMSNSWGYRANKDPSGLTYYYTYRGLSNRSYTSETGINWLSHMGTQGDGGRWKSEMITNSYTQALDELIESGVIFVVAAGNSNQKQVGSDHPDFNNYITRDNLGSLENSRFFEFGIAVTGTTNRRGFPQQAGMYDEDGTRIYPAINIGALNDNFNDGKEAKVNYSDRGEQIDIYAPADGTLAANRGSTSVGNRVDTYPLYKIGEPELVDTGLSAVCSSSNILIGGDFVSSPESSFRIITSIETANITEISSNFLGITSNAVTIPSTGNNDDGFFTVALPWTVTFNGSNYDVAYVGTNSYLTFGGGSTSYSSISPSNPPFDKICVSSRDNSVQRIYTSTSGVSPNREFTIRIQGTASTGGTLGNPNMEWEFRFFENSADKIELHINLNARYALEATNAPLVATDRSFNGTSAACPVAAGFISTVLEYNRTWSWQDVKAWLQTLQVQSTDRFYVGTESTDQLTANWTDYASLEGGVPRVLYQDPDVYNVIPILSPNIRSRASGKLSFKNGIRLRKR